MCSCPGSSGKGFVMNDSELKKMAAEVRKGIVESVHSAKAGHPGGSLSAAMEELKKAGEALCQI